MPRPIAPAATFTLPAAPEKREIRRRIVFRKAADASGHPLPCWIVGEGGKPGQRPKTAAKRTRPCLSHWRRYRLRAERLAEQRAGLPLPGWQVDPPRDYSSRRISSGFWPRIRKL